MKKLSATIAFSVLCAAACFAQTLTLDSCLLLAYRNNADILSSRLEIDKAREVKAQVFTKYFPQVSANALSYHALKPLVEFGISDIQSADARRVLQALYDLVKSETDLSDQISLMKYGTLVSGVAIQPIFAGGRIVNANRLANLGIEAAKTQAEVSKRDIIENVESTYFLVLGLQEKVATVDSTLSLLDSLTKTVNVALNAGLVTKSDALQVELKKNEMRHAASALQCHLPRLATALHSDRHRLSRRRSHTFRRPASLLFHWHSEHPASLTCRIPARDRLARHASRSRAIAQENIHWRSPPASHARRRVLLGQSGQNPI